MAEQTTPSSER
ncbi:hypothetical protein LINPERHAP1_LOCUS3913 [Linum perenne]